MDVIQRGSVPNVVETGPFGFIKNTFKYDVLFDAEDSSRVTYKEYSYVQEVNDPAVCEEWFYRYKTLKTISLKTFLFLNKKRTFPQYLIDWRKITNKSTPVHLGNVCARTSTCPSS